MVFREVGVGITPDVDAVLYVERDAKNVLITVQEQRVLIEDEGGGILFAGVGGGGDRVEVFIDETPAVLHAAIAFVPGSQPGFRKMKINVPGA